MVETCNSCGFEKRKRSASGNAQSGQIGNRCKFEIYHADNLKSVTVSGLGNEWTTCPLLTSRHQGANFTRRTARHQIRPNLGALCLPKSGGTPARKSCRKLCIPLPNECPAIFIPSHQASVTTTQDRCGTPASPRWSEFFFALDRPPRLCQPFSYDALTAGKDTNEICCPGLYRRNDCY
ncbi:hypothetical protein Brsp02_03546 [Brucella sp. NBRC 113783]